MVPPGMTLRRRRWKLLIFLALSASICCYIFYPSIVIRGWEPGRSRWLSGYILPREDTSLIEAKVCADSPKVLIVVLSAVGNFLQRAAIRATWASTRHHSSYAVAFLLGVDADNDSTQELVEKEHHKYGDIIQEDFVDAYENLTLKSAMMLKHMTRNCLTTSYLLKVDDDVYLHTGNLLRLVGELDAEPEKEFMVGNLMQNEQPHRSRLIFSKWACPAYMYDKPFPPYLSGASGYLMTRSTAVKLFEMALKTPILHLEDVFLAGIVAQRANITLRNHDGFLWMMNPEDVCSYPSQLIDRFIVSHKISHVGLQRLWRWINHKTDSSSDCSQVRILWGYIKRLLQLP